MDGLQKAEFPVVDGVEIRTFGDPNRHESNHYRCIKLAFLRKAPVRPVGNLLFAVADKLLLVDVEQGGVLVTAVKSVTIDDGTRGLLMGRLVRQTSDHVETNDTRFSAGYRFVTTDGDPSRPVSEPFMLAGVETLDEAAFTALEEDARAKYHQALYTANRESPTAWGTRRPNP